MKLTQENQIKALNCLWLALLVGLFSPCCAEATGTWTPLVHSPPVGVNNCLLLSDGTVFGMNGAGQCAKLTPDSHGSYANGTWASLPTMNYGRLFFSSDLLTNGNVYVSGGEYGNTGGHAELYDSLANTWTLIQPGGFFTSDASSKILPNGNVLQSDSQSGTWIYNTVSNVVSYNGGAHDENEACWVKLASGSIFSIDNYGGNAAHFVPSLNNWYQDSSSPPAGAGGGDNALFLLPNGQVINFGSVSQAAIYTPGSTDRKSVV